MSPGFKRRSTGYRMAARVVAVTKAAATIDPTMAEVGVAEETMAVSLHASHALDIAQRHSRTSTITWEVSTVRFQSVMQNSSKLVPTIIATMVRWVMDCLP